MSKRKIKKSKSQKIKTEETVVKKPNVFKRMAVTTGKAVKTAAIKTKDGVVFGACATGRGVKTGALATKNAFVGLQEKAKLLVERVKAGEKLAEECSRLADALREAADKTDLLDAAKELRIQADKLEAIAKEM